MGAAQLKQNWRHHYTQLIQNSYTSTTIIQHNTTQEKFELITFTVNDQNQKTSLQHKLKNRQTNKPRFIRHLEQVFFKQQDQFCGTLSKFQLVYEFGSSRLQSVFNQRKNKNLGFHDEEIFYIIIHVFKALKEVELLKQGHGNVNMRNIIINSQVKLEDNLVVQISQNELIQTRNSTQCYPSPHTLLSKVDSGLYLDLFCQDLFSLGMVALQLYLPFEHIKNAYRNKNAPYQNQRKDFHFLYDYLRLVKNQQLYDCFRLLLSSLPKERAKVVNILQHVNVSKQNIKLLDTNTKIITNQQQLAQIVNPNIKSFSQNRPQLSLSGNGIKKGQPNILHNPHQNHLHNRQIRKHSGPPTFFQQPIQRPLINIPYQQQIFTTHSQTSMQPHFSSSNRPKSYSSINFQHYGKNQTTNSNINNLNFNLPNYKVLDKQQNGITKEEHKIKFQTKPPAFFASIQQQKQATPIKNLSQFISPSKEIPFPQQSNRIQNKTLRHNNQSIAALQQQLAQLQFITKKNEQLQQKLNIEARNLFGTKQSLPLHSQAIVEETFEDSKIEEPQYVVQEYQQGHRYQGYVQKNMRNGYGKFYYSGGSIYDGEWVDSKMCGYGQLFYPNGQLAYQGFFKNDEFQGKGILKNDSYLAFTHNYDYRNLRRIQSSEWKLYDGEWCKDKKQGKGRLILSNNQAYEGQFNKDMPHGYGIFREQNGTKIKGIWNQGILQSIIP